MRLICFRSGCIAISACMLISLITSCAALPSLEKAESFTPMPASPAPSITRQLELTASPNPNKGFPMSMAEFQMYFNDYVLIPWTPSMVLDYIEDGSTLTDLESCAYIVSVIKGSVEVNDVLWVSDDNEPNGFRVDDTSQETKTFKLTEDTEIWLLTGMMGYCRIPAGELESFANSEMREYTLWNYSSKDGKIIMMVEQYIP